jgi:glycerophosphoryl diester phosphodiesterase
LICSLSCSIWSKIGLKKPRFPADKESVAREAIRTAVAQEKALTSGSMIGIAGGANGGDSVIQLHANGLTVFAYTLNDPRDIARAQKLGIDGIVSDYPERIPKSAA